MKIKFKPWTKQAPKFPNTHLVSKKPSTHRLLNIISYYILLNNRIWSCCQERGDWRNRKFKLEITLGTNLAEAYGKVLLYVHQPPQLSYHTGNCNPTCNHKNMTADTTNMLALPFATKENKKKNRSKILGSWECIISRLVIVKLKLCVLSH